MTPILLIDASITAARNHLSRCGTARSYEASNLHKCELQEVQGLVCRTTTRVGSELLDRAPSLKFVATASAGHDHLDLDALRARGIQWFSSPGCNASSVADYSMTAIARALPRVRISRKPRIGVIGVGHVGTQVARRCAALGFEVLACDPPRAEREAGPKELAVADQASAPVFHPLAALLRGCDLLTVHVPLTSEGDHPTRGLVRADHLATAAVQAVVNTSRGGVVEAARAARLPNAPLQAIDVWEHEPTPSADLLRAPSLVMATPHIAGYGAAGKWAASAQLVPKISAFSQASALPAPEFDPPDAPEIALHYHDREGFPPLAEILGALLGLDDVDRALRATASDAPSTRATSFRSLRNARPYRVEFAHRSVVVHAPVSAREQAQTLIRTLKACGVGQVAAASPEARESTPRDA